MLTLNYTELAFYIGVGSLISGFLVYTLLSNKIKGINNSLNYKKKESMSLYQENEALRGSLADMKPLEKLTDSSLMAELPTHLSDAREKANSIVKERENHATEVKKLRDSVHHLYFRLENYLIINNSLTKSLSTLVRDITSRKTLIAYAETDPTGLVSDFEGLEGLIETHEEESSEDSAKAIDDYISNLIARLILDSKKPVDFLSYGSVEMSSTKAVAASVEN